MYARFLFGITAKFINDCVNTSEKVVITLWGQFVAVLKLWILFQCCFGHESINKQNIVPLFPHELSGSCWSCHNVSNVWQRSPVARPGPGVLRSVHVCTHVSARFLNTELTSSICVLGVCGARGHSLIDSGRVNVEHSGSSACLSVPLQPFHSWGTTHPALSILRLHCSVKHTLKILCNCWCPFIMQRTGDVSTCSS